jgi:hypothetical protein
VPWLLLRVEQAQRHGYRRTTLAASLAYENVLQLATALLVAFVLLLASMSGHLGAFWLYGLALVPLVGAAVLVQPRVLVPCANRIARLLRRPEISSESVLPTRAMARAVLLYALFVVINGLGFYCALNAVRPVGPGYMPAAIGIYNLAGVIGILAVVTPSGLGVREGIIIGLVSLQYPLEVAAAAAVIARVASIPADGLPAALFFASDHLRPARLRGLLQRRPFARPLGERDVPDAQVGG